MYYNEYEEERLYSTGSDELDDLMTKAFCEGYNDFYQKNFGLFESLSKTAKRNKLAGELKGIRKERDVNMKEISKKYKSPFNKKFYGDIEAEKASERATRAINNSHIED